jgi:alkanesulfonate monooxygenase SsuD/methylene tetrahydromethanopterin reductase-like flavin-dependent oxidoreductase (luciferase family)
MRHAIFLPIFGELSDPRVVARLASSAEEHGWDGVFVWDHIHYRSPADLVADPWITMAAVACATERIRIGPMVTPVTRRRPQKLARETTSLDILSEGRLVFGVGLGSDGSAEQTTFGETADAREMAARLDEGLDVIEQLWSGEPVHHHGDAFTVDGARFLPRPQQRPRIPIWVAGRWPNRAPLRRAARYDGVFPIEMEHPDQLAEMVDLLEDLRAPDAVPFEVVVRGGPDDDPAPWRAAGATWWLADFSPFTVTAAEVAAVVAAGPPDPA